METLPFEAFNNLFSLHWGNYIPAFSHFSKRDFIPDSILNSCQSNSCKVTRTLFPWWTDFEYGIKEYSFEFLASEMIAAELFETGDRIFLITDQMFIDNLVLTFNREVFWEELKSAYDSDKSGYILGSSDEIFLNPENGVIVIIHHEGGRFVINPKGNFLCSPQKNENPILKIDFSTKDFIFKFKGGTPILCATYYFTFDENNNDIGNPYPLMAAYFAREIQIIRDLPVHEEIFFPIGFYDECISGIKFRKAGENMLAGVEAYTTDLHGYSCYPVDFRKYEFDLSSLIVIGGEMNCDLNEFTLALEDFIRYLNQLTD